MLKSVVFILVAVSAKMLIAQNPPGVIDANQYPSISAAIAALSGSAGEIWIPCGTYSDNIRIATSGVKLQGESVGCVTIQPANSSIPVITIDASSAGPSGIGYDEVLNMTIQCPSSCPTYGLEITGTNSIDQPNDWHKISRLVIEGGFAHGIYVAGRTIWSTFENIQVTGTNGDGFHISGSDVFNFNVFRDSRSANNQGYGIYLNNTNANAAESNTWDRINIEYNGESPSYFQGLGLPCAGFYANGTGGGNNILGSVFEGNCDGNPVRAHIIFDGTFDQGWTIRGNEFNSPYGEWAIRNTATWTSGEYSSNYLLSNGIGNSFYIATSFPLSSVTLGVNTLQGTAGPVIVPDANGATHTIVLNSANLGNALSGTRFVCIDTNGMVVSQPVACSGS